MTTDLFEAFGDSMLSPGAKRARDTEAKRDAARAAKAAIPPMVLKGLEKEQAEKAKQLIKYREWKREVREGMARGDYGEEIVELFKQLRRPSRAKDLVNYILNAGWLLKCSHETRTTLLSYIDDAITRHRIRQGLSPFDDPLPDQPDNAWLIIRRHLMWDER